MKPEWKLPELDLELASEMARKTGISPVTAALLIQRGFAIPEDATAFLNPSLDALRPPDRMKDIDKAVDRIIQAISDNQKILVFGDYDVDGVTGTLLLFDFLTAAGADVSYYIPHRIREGYSFKPDHVKRVLVPRRTELVVTVDCGSDSVDAVDAATALGIDVVVTDHHSVPDHPPRAHCIVNPKRKDCPSGLEHLAGVGVVFYVLIALRKALRDRGFWRSRPEPNLKNACDLVALGTIADIVPLVAENRVLTKTGIDIINMAPRTGLKSLIDISRIQKEQLNTDDIAFRIVPRLNAAGRINHADLAMQLLSSATAKAAKPIAQTLDSLNSQRQSVEQAVFDEIESFIDRSKEALEKPALIFQRQGWHLGVLGIVASKLCRKYNRPVILIAMDGDTGKGSGRSIPGISLYDVLSDCSETLAGFGGHAMAAGLEIKTTQLRSFRETFFRVLSERALSGAPQPVDIDARLDFDDITPALLDELERFQPFGNTNPEPLFIAHDITVVSSMPVGSNHRRLVLSSESSARDDSLMAMHFNIDPSVPCPSRFRHLVFKLQWNRWNNTRSPQIIVEDFL